MLGTDQPEVLGKFYEQVFDKKPDMQDSNWWGWQIGDCYFNVGEHSEVKGKAETPQRIMLNLQTDEIEKEFARIEKIEGITVVKKLYEMDGMKGMWISTLADPDGNYFQLMTPWKESDSQLN